MSIWLVPFAAFFWSSAFAGSPEVCQFYVDDKPYQAAPTCGDFETIKVSCGTPSAVRKGGYDLVEYKLWLSHLDVSAKKYFDGDKVSKFLDRSGKMVLWISNPGEQKAEFEYPDQPAAMRDLCEAPRKYKHESIDVEVIAKGFHQTGWEEEAEWDEYQETWITNKYPVYDDGTRIAYGKMAITQLPPEPTVTDADGVIEVELIDPKTTEGKPTQDTIIPFPGVELTAKTGEGWIRYSVTYLDDDVAKQFFSNLTAIYRKIPEGMEPYDFIKQDIERYFQPEFDSDGREVNHWAWDHVWGDRTKDYDLENENLQRMSSGGRAAAKKAKKLFASLDSLPADKVEKTRAKAEKAQARADKERAAFPIKHTGWIEEEHSGIQWLHWRLEQTPGTFIEKDRYANEENVLVEPTIVHCYLGRSGDRTVMLWGEINERFFEIVPGEVAEAERIFAETADLIQLLK